MPTDSKSPEFLFTATDKNKKGTAKASIKDISADGVVLSVEQSDSLWNICVTKAGELKSDTLGITIMHDARVRAMYELTDSVTRIALNNDDLETEFSDEQKGKLKQIYYSGFIRAGL